MRELWFLLHCGLIICCCLCCQNNRYSVNLLSLRLVLFTHWSPYFFTLSCVLCYVIQLHKILFYLNQTIDKYEKYIDINARLKDIEERPEKTHCEPDNLTRNVPSVIFFKIYYAIYLKNYYDLLLLLLLIFVKV